jgi:hypothetical protein
MNRTKELFTISMKLWGLDSQMLMLAEEAGELSVATLHLGRKLKDKAEAWEKFAEEIADVEFMIEEIKDYFPVLQGKVNLYRQRKEERLQNLLSKEKVVVEGGCSS